MSDGTNGAIITSTIRQETNRLPKSNKTAFVALSCLKKEKKKKIRSDSNNHNDPAQ